jgi:exodeoxyribonuclease-5
MINDPVEFSKLLLNKYPFSPTSGQEELLKSLSVFLFSKEERPLFVLKGYAGTGKTSSMSTFVKQLWQTGKKSVLLAPTGRAAKVLGMYTGKAAFTIHKKIYSPKKRKVRWC